MALIRKGLYSGTLSGAFYFGFGIDMFRIVFLGYIESIFYCYIYYFFPLDVLKLILGLDKERCVPEKSSLAGSL